MEYDLEENKNQISKNKEEAESLWQRGAEVAAELEAEKQRLNRTDTKLKAQRNVTAVAREAKDEIEARVAKKEGEKIQYGLA